MKNTEEGARNGGQAVPSFANWTVAERDGYTVYNRTEEVDGYVLNLDVDVSMLEVSSSDPSSTLEQEWADFKTKALTGVKSQ